MNNDGESTSTSTFCGFGPRPLEVEVDESAGGSNQGKMYWAQNVEYFLSSTRPD